MKHRREEFTCVICLENLFDARDDLDEVMPTVATHCGHVFHKPCIDAATKASSERWLTTQYDVDPETDYTISDAPAECPSCRSEIFADELTGELEFIKLYLSRGQHGGGTQMSSSSPRQGAADGPLYSLARRAKSTRELTERLSEQSQPDEVHRLMTRAQGVVEDGLSDRAVAAVKNHLQLLAASITALTNTLRSNPLIPELQRAYTVLEETVTTERRTYKRLRDTEMPAAIRAAVHDERMRMGDLLKEERKEKERFKMELDREKASRRAATASWEDRIGSSRREIENAQRNLQQEVENVQELERRLRERTAQLKTCQTKLESRKHLKDDLQKAQLENASLRKRLDESGPDRSRSQLSPVDIWSDDAADQTLPDEEDSLQVELPPSSPPPVRHPTARTIACHVRATAAGPIKRKECSDGVLQPTRMNPFATTKSAGEKKKTLTAPSHTLSPVKKKPRQSIIDLTEISPDEPEPSRQRSKFFPAAAVSPTVTKKAAPLVDRLVLRDALGRPSKGVASGPRVSRR